MRQSSLFRRTAYLLFLPNELCRRRIAYFVWHHRVVLISWTDIEKFLSERDVSLSNESPNPGGGNYGDIEVLDNIVRFSSGNKCVEFEL